MIIVVINLRKGFRVALFTTWKVFNIRNGYVYVQYERECSCFAAYSSFYFTFVEITNVILLYFIGIVLVTCVLMLMNLYNIILY